MQALIAAGVVAAVLAATGAIGGGGGGAAGTSAPGATAARLTADRFDGARAWRLLRAQVRMGPRPAGSPAAQRLAQWLRARLPGGRLEPVPGHPGLDNVVGRLPGRAPAIVLAAHYDTKDIPGFVGANDGAGGTAAVLELARALGRIHRPADAPELRFVLFDGEEAPGDGDFYETGDRGSKAYAAAHHRELRALVLLDFVANERLRLPREAGSDAALWERMRAAARRVGAGAAFPGATRSEILDDHTPFARRGVAAIDLIDFDFPCWHRTCDDLHAVAPHSLDLTGESVLELVRSWR